MKLRNRKNYGLDEDDEDDELDEEEEGSQIYLVDGDGPELDERLRNLEIVESKKEEKKKEEEEEEVGEDADEDSLGDLDKILKAVLRGVQNSMKSIDDEVLGEMKEGRQGGRYNQINN